VSLVEFRESWVILEILDFLAWKAGEEGGGDMREERGEGRGDRRGERRGEERGEEKGEKRG
jgi:hypothetical protein